MQRNERLRISLALTLGSLFGSGLAAQQTLVVGTGAQYLTIPAAVAAAQAGDTVLVQAGTYDGNIDIDKGIHLVGEGAKLVRGGILQPGMSVHDVPLDETFSMRGFVADGAGGDMLLTVTDCQGPVTIGKLGQHGFSLWSVRVRGCDQMHLASVIVRSLSLVDSTTQVERCIFDPTAVGVGIEGGQTAFARCSIRGGSGVLGSSAILLQEGDVALTRCTVLSTSLLGAPAIDTVGGGILLDPSTLITSPNGVPPIAGSATVVPLELASLVTDLQPGLLTVENHGVAGQGFVTVLSPTSPALVTPIGFAWVDPASIAIVTAGVYPATRLDTQSLPLPALPPGLTVALQTAVFTANGVLLSTPSLASVL